MSRGLSSCTEEELLEELKRRYDEVLFIGLFTDGTDTTQIKYDGEAEGLDLLGAIEMVKHRIICKFELDQQEDENNKDEDDLQDNLFS